MTSYFLRMFLLFSLFVGWAVSASAEIKKPPLHLIPASACGECHKDLYQQWAGSMHAQSSALKDPIHKVLYNAQVGDPTLEDVKHKVTGGYPACLKCHAPNAARDGKTKLDAMESYGDGVSCVSCHTMVSFNGVQGKEGEKMNMGTDAYTFSETHLQGPNGAFSGKKMVHSPGSAAGETAINSFPHQGNAKLFKTSDVCLGCHEKNNNPNGVPVCSTGPELVQSGNTVTCQSCHMPTVNGFTDHSMAGGHNPAMLKRGILVSLTGEKSTTGGKVSVKLKNLLPHNYPTGAPFRVVVLRVSALDAKGEVIWKNFDTNPMEQDSKAVLMLKLVDENDQPTAPPNAKKIKEDSRLKPGEERQLDYDIPVEGVAKVRAELSYSLLLPPIVKQFDAELPPEAKQPVLVSRTELNL
ncbi:MAG TPA: cytochrome c family protein [Magnetococcales bacterium]|nr:cytochrome c family protein [Magnetococcales bacterium]